MSEQRIVVETLCEHEELGEHWGRFGVNRSLVECPGGSRRIVELPDMEKLREAVDEWDAIPSEVPDEAQPLAAVFEAARWVLSFGEVD